MVGCPSLPIHTAERASAMSFSYWWVTWSPSSPSGRLKYGASTVGHSAVRLCSQCEWVQAMDVVYPDCCGEKTKQNVIFSSGKVEIWGFFSQWSSWMRLHKLRRFGIQVHLCLGHSLKCSQSGQDHEGFRLQKCSQHKQKIWSLRPSKCSAWSSYKVCFVFVCVCVCDSMNKHMCCLYLCTIGSSSNSVVQSEMEQQQDRAFKEIPFVLSAIWN